MQEAKYIITDSKKFWPEFVKQNFEGIMYNPQITFEDKSRMIEDKNNFRIISKYIEDFNRKMSSHTFTFENKPYSIKQGLIRELYGIMAANGFKATYFHSKILVKNNVEYSLTATDKDLKLSDISKHTRTEPDKDKRQSIEDFLGNNKFVEKETI